MLTISNFCKQYGQVIILKIPEFHLPPGIHWIRGPNGSGKSTLFKSIAGIIPFEGDIYLGEINQKQKPRIYRQQVSYAEAEPLYPDYLRGTDLLAYVAEARGVKKNHWLPLCERFDMQSYIDTPCGTYSSGMLKKLSLVMALLGKSRLNLLDEAFITIDSQSTRILCEIIGEYHNQLEISFLLSSHQFIEEEMLHLDAVYEISGTGLNEVKRS
ncbi:MAG: ATP-binding cassette domain-containing protein [Cyclobacteriaceae bacterium]